MVVQFFCPRGHLLQVDGSMVGRPCRCPHCDTLFRVPSPASVVGPAEAAGPAEPEVVHVLCPSGHPLETPREMLGQPAMCPFCQAQFPLRLEDSVEYRRRKAEERARRERKAARAWLYWSITAAVVVLLGLILLIVFAAQVP